MDPLTASALFTAAAPMEAGATAGAGAAGAGAAEAGGAAALANPITAAIMLAALGTAYGTSPTVRKYTNKMAKGGYEAVTNPFQHLGDGSPKDSLFAGPLRGGNMPGLSGSLFGNAGLSHGGMLGGQMDLSGLGGMNGQMDLSHLMGMGGQDSGRPKSLLDISKFKGQAGQEGQQKQQQNNQQQQAYGPYGLGGGIEPIPSPNSNIYYPYPNPPQLKPSYAYAQPGGYY